MNESMPTDIPELLRRKMIRQQLGIVTKNAVRAQRCQNDPAECLRCLHSAVRMILKTGLLLCAQLVYVDEELTE